MRDILEFKQQADAILAEVTPEADLLHAQAARLWDILALELVVDNRSSSVRELIPALVLSMRANEPFILSSRCKQTLTNSGLPAQTPRLLDGMLIRGLIGQQSAGRLVRSKDPIWLRASLKGIVIPYDEQEAA